MIEYALLTALIAVALVGTIGVLGHEVEKTFVTAEEAMGAPGQDLTEHAQ